MASVKRPPGPTACLRPEHLVGLCFRRGVAALETKETCYWEFAWQALAEVAGPERATELVAELLLWCQSVRKSSGRRIETLPLGCPGFCRDECLAISMIAASQNGVCPALRACAFALLGSNRLDEPIETAARFGRGLAEAGQILSSYSVCDGLAAMPVVSQRPS